jgi:putative ATPase
MRGSDPNAAVYWLARMIDGGEDVKFIARRMIIFASEDIGNANPNALLLANTTFEAVNKIGAIYLATSVKSNASYMAIEDALHLVKQFGDLPVPLSIRNAVTPLMKNQNYGKGYQYDHHSELNFSGQEFLPDEIKSQALYQPGKNTKEEEIRAFLKERWKEKYNY